MYMGYATWESSIGGELMKERRQEGLSNKDLVT